MATPSSVTERSLRGKPYRWTSPDTAGFRPRVASICCQSISCALAETETMTALKKGDQCMHANLLTACAPLLSHRPRSH